MSENRRYPRAPVNVEVTVEDIQGKTVTGIGVLLLYASNISLGGVFIETNIPFECGSKLKIEFTLPETPRPLIARGRVIRISGGKSSNLNGVGIEFQDLSVDDKKVIDSYIINQSVEK
ncbi:MAG: PilZ domain-containing protein [bacterium]